LLQAVFNSNWIAPVGPMLGQFEEVVSSYVGSNHALALNSATSAIHLGLKVLGVKEGDKVLCSTFTFVASVNPITYIGATPILVDAEQDTWNICPVALEQAIKAEMAKGQKPKAMVLVHGYGMPAKVDEVLKIAKKHDIFVLEDAASALGAKYKHQFCGTFGAVGAYSFNGNKIITTSGGGIMVSNDEDKIRRALSLSRQAKDGSGNYEYQNIGYNYRMSNVLAAIGAAQMECLKEFVEIRKRNYNFYKTALKDVEVEFLEANSSEATSNFWLTVVLFPTLFSQVLL